MLDSALQHALATLLQSTMAFGHAAAACPAEVTVQALAAQDMWDSPLNPGQLAPMGSGGQSMESVCQVTTSAYKSLPNRAAAFSAQEV